MGRQREQEEKARQKREREAMLEFEAQQQREEQARRADQKKFIKNINMLLAEKSVGILFEDLANEYFLKYNAEWNPEDLFGTNDMDMILRMVPDTKVLKGGVTQRVMDRKHYNKIEIISRDTNDILTVLAISEDIESAMRQLRQMLNQRQDAIQEELARQRAAEQERKERAEKERREREEQRRRDEEREWKRKQQAQAQAQASAMSRPQVGASAMSAGQYYSRQNNWGLPPGFRVQKTPQGRLFYINDHTRKTQWDDPRPLPQGWRMNKTPQGRPFYIDDNTKKTSWNDPRPVIQI